jgi:hypothetical protein
VERIRRLQLTDSLALIFYGAPTYWSSPSVTIQSTDVPRFHSALGKVVAPEGAYLLLLLRYYPPSEPDYKARVREVTLRSLLGTSLGENLVYRRLFENAVRLDKPEVGTIGMVFRNPNAWPPPDISDVRLDRARELDVAIEALEEHERNRVRLSLRWHGEARNAEGIESFTKQWVALEALGMANTSNIAPLVHALSRAYEITVEESKDRFQVGRLFGFRSEILHRGLIPSIDASLLDYLRALYKDILWQRVGFPSERDAEDILRRDGFDLTRLLRHN